MSLMSVVASPVAELFEAVCSAVVDVYPALACGVSVSCSVACCD